MLEKMKKVFRWTLPAALVLSATAVSADWDVSSYDSFGLPDSTIGQIVSAVLSWMLGIIGVLGIIGFVISGILYLTSAGDSGQADKAKSAMMYSIIGIVVALAGFIILQAINTLLNAGVDA